MNNYFLTLATVLLVYMSFWYLVSIVKKRNDVADIAWGLGFVLLSWTSFFIAGNFSSAGLAVSAIVTIWGLRLALHIYARNKNKTEDYRYLEWRREWGEWFYLRSYFQVYLLQGLLLYLIAIPVLAINYDSGMLIGAWFVLGLTVWIVGYFFEVVGDWQLAQFIRIPTNKGKLMTTGLWAYSRHPNYFGEVTQWWGLWLISLPSTLGWISIAGPLTITFLILKVSGIPLLEKNMEMRPGFAEYKKRVSIFIPLPPKK